MHIVSRMFSIFHLFTLYCIGIYTHRAFSDGNRGNHISHRELDKGGLSVQFSMYQLSPIHDTQSFEPNFHVDEVIIFVKM